MDIIYIHSKFIYYVMDLLQSLDSHKQLIFLFFQQKFEKIKAIISVKSPKQIFLFLIFLWALYTYAREKGWLLKKSVKSKHIFITGGGSGLGREMALKFSKLGANVTICDLNPITILETVELIKNNGNSVFSLQLDISDRQGIKMSVSEAF